MILKIYWNKRAERKFLKTIDYLKDEWGEKASDEYLLRVFEIIDLISKFPEMGTMEVKERNIRGFVITKQVTLFYKVRNDKLLILNFFDNRQNPNKKKY